MHGLHSAPSDRPDPWRDQLTCLLLDMETKQECNRLPALSHFSNTSHTTKLDLL